MQLTIANLQIDLCSIQCVLIPLRTYQSGYKTGDKHNQLVGFGRACAPVRCAHPSFWAHYHAKRGAARPPPPPSPSQLRCFLFTPQNFPLGPNSGRQGHISFHWAKLHPTELHCISLSYAAPSWRAPQLATVRCTLLSYAVPLIYAAFNWVRLHPI
jgi:hypothetical protein